MSSLSVDRDGAIPSCSTSRSAGAFSTMIHQSPTTSIKSASPRIGSTTKLEEDIGTNKSGMVVGCMAFTKSAKKMYYAVLSDRCFVLHENQKSYKKKKAARHIFDLATCFNVNRHEDAKMKTCVSIMTPDETFIFKAVDEDKPRDDTATLDWYDAMMTVVVPARALFLGRPVLATEFFEYCWDVFLVSKPRIRKPTSNPENFENICAKRPELATRHRLGFYAHTIILCKMGTQPALSGHPKSGIPPFKTESFIEIQRQFVASFGFQEKYFILRIGRAAATGMCEIWAQCESEEVADDIHKRLNQIIEREAEKKRQQQSASGSNSNHQMISGLNQTSTNNFCEVSNFLKAETRETSLPAVGSSSSLSSKKITLRRNNLNLTEDDEIAPHLATQKVVFNRSTISAKSIDQAVLRDITRHEQKSAETQTRSHTIGGQSSSTNSWLNLLRRGNQKKEEKPKTFPVSMMNQMECGKHRVSLVSGTSVVDDETEDSGGTLKVVDCEDYDVKRKQPMLVNGMYPHEMLIETAFINHDLFCGNRQRGSISSSSDQSAEFGQRKRQMTIGSDSGKGEDLDHNPFNRSTLDDSSSINADESSLSDMIGCPQHFDEVDSTTSSLSVDHPDKSCDLSGSTSHLLSPPTTDHHLEDVRSYISDSSDSCYSSNATTSFLNPRAYSFSNNLQRMQQNSYEPMQPSKFPTIQYSKDLRKLDEVSSLASIVSIDGMQLGEEAATTAPILKCVRIQEIPSSQFLNPKEDLRKRAFSLGSKSWIMKPFRKLSHQNGKSNSGSKSSSITGDCENDCNENIANHHFHPETNKPQEIYATMHTRSDSIDYFHSHHLNERKSSSILKKNGVNDLVEVNFSPPSSQNSIIAQYNNIGTNRHSSNSVDSPVRSRASSFVTRRSNNSGKNSVCGDIRKSVDQEEPIVEAYEPMQQVRCFIQAGDDDIMNVLSFKDTTSLHSLKNDVNHFETIEENGSPSPSRGSSRLSRRSLEPKSPTESDIGFKYRKDKDKSREFKLQPPMEEISYAIIAPFKPVDRKIKTQKEPTL